MTVYIAWEMGRRRYSIFNRATGEYLISFNLRPEAIRYAVGRGWIIVKGALVA